mgnify:FL=1
MRSQVTVSLLLGTALILSGCPEKKVVKPTKKKVVRIIFPEELYNRGIDALEQGKPERALELLQKAVAKNEKRPDPAPMIDAHYNLGLLQLRQGNLEAAELAFKTTLQKAPEHRDALLNLGVVYKRQQKYDQAIEHYRKALKQVPRDPEIMNNLIVVYRLAKKYAQAEKTGHRLLARAPNNVEAYKNMTLVYYDQGKYEMAELLCINAGKMLEKRRQKNPALPKDAGIFNNLGMIYVGMERYRDALDQFDQALKIEPDNVNALINVAAIAHRFRDYRRAMAAYQKVLQQQPDHPVAVKGMAYAYYGVGDAKKAIELFTKVLEREPQNSDILFKMGEVYNKQLRDYENAIAYYERYKQAKGRQLDRKDPVHNRIKIAKTKLQMATQLRQQEAEEERRRRKEEDEKRRQALEETKRDKDAGKEGQKKLGDLIKDDEPEAGEQPAAGEEAGEDEAGEQKAGDEEAAEKKAGDEEAAEQDEAGEQKAGEDEAAEKKAGDEEAAERKAGAKKAAEKGPAEEEATEKKEESGKEGPAAEGAAG